MSDPRPQFGLFPNLYLGLFIALLLAAPFLILAPWHSSSVQPWVASAFGTAVLVGLLLLASRLCSSPSLSYRDGLLFVIASMMTGWVQLSAVFVFPALLIAVTASIVIAGYSWPIGGGSGAPERFHRLVAFFHRHRMHQ